MKMPINRYMSKKPRDHLFQAVGGRDGILKVVKIFYDKVYADPWMSLFFAKIPQEHIENQQTDFMCGAMGGPKIYCGRMPVDAHEHICITEELFDARDELLEESLKEANVDPEVAKAWMKIDQAFKSGLVKPLKDCKKRFFTDEILDFENPNPRKKAA